jgi:hypothetical protein
MANGNGDKTWTTIARIGYAAMLLVMVTLAFGSAHSRLNNLEKDHVSEEVITLKFQIIADSLERNNTDHEKILQAIAEIKKDN